MLAKLGATAMQKGTKRKGYCLTEGKQSWWPENVPFPKMQKSASGSVRSARWQSLKMADCLSLITALYSNGNKTCDGDVLAEKVLEGLRGNPCAEELGELIKHNFIQEVSDEEQEYFVPDNTLVAPLRFLCDQCDEKFSNQTSLQKHKQEVHQQESSSESSDSGSDTDSSDHEPAPKRRSARSTAGKVPVCSTGYCGLCAECPRTLR